MKKLFFFAAVISLSVTSCKKDRVCSCKTVTKTNGQSDVVSDQDYTIMDVSKSTARKACVHKKSDIEVNGSVVGSIDQNCSLK